MDHAELVDALDHVWSSTSDVLHGVDASAWDRSTGCPGWTVRDQVSHLIWSADLWRGVAPEPVELPELAHVHGPIGEYMELAVHARRGRAAQDVLDEFDASRTAAIDDLRSRLPAGLDAPLCGPMGHEMPRAAFLTISVFDQWVHGHDIRLALGLRSDRSSTAARHSLAQIVASWSVSAEDAPAVAVSVADLPADGSDPGDGTAGPHRIGAGDPAASIELSFDDLVTLAAGRDRPVSSLAVAGDQAAAEAVLGRLPVTP